MEKRKKFTGISRKRGMSGLENQSRFFAKARPEGVFRYASKSNALFRSVKTMAVFIRHGLYFEVCETCLEL